MWEQSGVLFVTVNIPGGSNNDDDQWNAGAFGAVKSGPQIQEVAQRTAADLRWLDAAFKQATRDGVAAMVILLQADMWDIDGANIAHLTGRDFVFVRHDNGTKWSSAMRTSYVTAGDVGPGYELPVPHLAQGDSQLAVPAMAMGRRRANATFHQSHGVDANSGAVFGMDLTPLLADDALDPIAFVAGHLDRFRDRYEEWGMYMTDERPTGTPAAFGRSPTLIGEGSACQAQAVKQVPACS